ncbi:hypothetical protein D3C72_1729100 [compost metagenome]
MLQRLARVVQAVEHQVPVGADADVPVEHVANGTFRGTGSCAQIFKQDGRVPRRCQQVHGLAQDAPVILVPGSVGATRG